MASILFFKMVAVGHLGFVLRVFGHKQLSIVPGQ